MVDFKRELAQMSVLRKYAEECVRRGICGRLNQRKMPGPEMVSPTQLVNPFYNEEIKFHADEIVDSLRYVLKSLQWAYQNVRVDEEAGAAEQEEFAERKSDALRVLLEFGIYRR